MIYKQKKIRQWCKHKKEIYSYNGKRRKVRCPECNRRIVLRAQFELGGCFDYWYIPKHKTKPMSKRL
jgi:DNA-directed RNA polymerase subunit RPC12/RpoP